MSNTSKRCAIYTRKSTEEGLEQEFNSLDAQREACVAYVTSQKSEGWSLIKNHYDDGGFTGGNIDRPALKNLIEDIKNRKIDIIVVYKIDRLTRSLMDFSRLVDIFDEYGVTFVSITQSFNTTTSMGRLTLNVLLSFAQFEREVISERVRDKVAASKKKGMWMGGNVPLGYNNENKKLVINTDEAKTVHHIYNSYLVTGSIRELKQYLDDHDIKSKGRKKSQKTEYASYSRGALYAILNNPIYMGKIRYKNHIYDGQHESIIDTDTWYAVQNKLTTQATAGRNLSSDKIDTLLKSRIFDCDGNRYTPCFTSKDNKRYRYYVSQNLLQYRDHPKHLIARIPAESLEQMITNTIKDILHTDIIFSIITITDMNHRKWIQNKRTNINTSMVLNTVLDKVVVSEKTLSIHLKLQVLTEYLAKFFDLDLLNTDAELYIHTIPFTTHRAGKGAVLILPQSSDDKPDPFAKTPLELKNWVRGIVWRNEFFSGTMIKDIASREKLDPRHVGRLIDASLNV